MRIVVTGSSGSLGGAVIAKAVAAGHEVVATSRRAPRSLPAGVVHRAADVTTGEGLAAALAGATAVIDATNAFQRAREVLVGGTRRVLEAARTAGVRHFIGVSIVGIDDAPFDYYRVKVDQEQVIALGLVPWTLVRATQFHDLLGRMSGGRLGVVVAPRGARVQPIDVREVAAALVAASGGQPTGRLPDMGGPQVLDWPTAVRAWKRAARLRRWVVAMPVPGARGRFLRGGGLCCPDRAVGTVTFAAWLREHYPA